MESVQHLTISYVNRIRVKKKSRKAFWFGLFLVVYSLVYFYLYESLSSLAAQLLTFFGFIISSGFVLLNFNRIQDKYKIIVVSMLFCMTLTNIINTATWGSMACLLMMLGGIYVLSNTSMSKNECKVLFVLFIILVALILRNCNIGNEFEEGKFNPNTGGFVLAMLFCVSFAAFLRSKKLFKKFLFLALAVACVYLQTIYISRTALLCCIVFAVLNLLFKTKNRKVKGSTVRRMVIIMAFVGIIIAVIYACILFRLLGYGKLVIFGKDLFTGRETIWNGAFDSISNNFLFGIGGDLNADMVRKSGNSLNSNAHNQPLGIMAVFGIPVFIIYYYLFSKAVVQKNKTMPAMLVIFVLVFMLMSCFDVYFFSIYNIGPILIAYCLIKNLVSEIRR